METTMTTAVPKLRATVRLYSGEAESSNLLAFADLTIADAFVIKGIKVLMAQATADKPARPFIGFPSRKGKGENDYQDVAHPITAEAYHAVRDVVLRAYEKATSPRGNA